MNTLKTILCAVTLLGSAMAFGQTATVEATAMAKARAAQLTTELALDAKQATAMEEVLMKAEQAVAGDRDKCAQIQANIDNTIMQSYAGLNGVLTPEQMSKLKTMPAASCSPGAKASTAGCAKDGAKAGCCAGKAGAHGAAAPAKSTIN